MIKSISAITALTSIMSFSAVADTYSISGGLMGLDVAIPPFGTKEVKFNPAPTGIDESNFYLDVNPVTGEVAMLEGSYLLLSDFEGSVRFFGTTRADITNTSVEFLNLTSGIVDASRRLRVTSGNASPSVRVNPTITNCSGPFCSMLTSSNMDLSSYTLDITFSADYSTFTGSFDGYTSEGSHTTAIVEGTRVAID